MCKSREVCIEEAMEWTLFISKQQLRGSRQGRFSHRVSLPKQESKPQLQLEEVPSKKLTPQVDMLAPVSLVLEEVSDNKQKAYC